MGGGDQPSQNLTRNIRLNWNFTPKPDLTNQATLAFNQWNSGTPEVTPWAGKADWTSYLGIGGVSPNYPTEFPNVQIGGTDYVGGGTPSVTNLHTTLPNDTMTWLRGKHTFKFGFQMRQGA